MSQCKCKKGSIPCQECCQSSDTSYTHVMGDDIGWDPEANRLNWSKEMKRAEVRKYLIRCECLQCKSLGRNFNWGWIVIDALWCVETRHKLGVHCPYCYHKLNDISHMVITIEDCGEPSEQEFERLDLDPNDYVELEDPNCYKI